MPKKSATAAPSSTVRDSLRDSYSRHLAYTRVRNQHNCTDHDQYYALALAIREKIIDQWAETQARYFKSDPKRLYYLSLEFLIGRMIENNVINLGIEDEVRGACLDLGIEYDHLRNVGEDAGLGNGGLGRLAACFLDSLATLDLPAMGYGIYYQYGIFRQEIINGFQHEEPDTWLKHGNPWETTYPTSVAVVQFGGRVIKPHGQKSSEYEWIDTEVVLAMPHDMPIVGYRNGTVNSLRLWSAHPSEEFNLKEFNSGDYFNAVQSKNTAESISKVLYPNDNNYEGKALRFKQQYFFVSASVQDIIRRYKKLHTDFHDLPAKVAIQLNDTHPALTILELMRILIDSEGLSFEEAWEITQRTCAYTNHTLLPEALEKWSIEFFEQFLPRHLMILFEINRVFLRDVALKFKGDEEMIRGMSLFQEHPEKQVRMAYLSIVGSHSVNGVAELHSDLLKKDLLKDFADLYPERFNNKTNGVTPRRWLYQCNPGLSELISDYIGSKWVRDLDTLQELEPYAKDRVFLDRFEEVKLQNKRILADYIERHHGFEVDPYSLFDVHIKRMHEYKRQLLNILHFVILYQRLKTNPDALPVPVTGIFSGKAAPGYFMAKLVIKLINAVGEFVNNDAETNHKLKIVFLENYRISLAEMIFPASDLSEQISTAGMEASGTGNMKFALNGALTIGTMDGANVEMAEEIGEENMFIFGLRADEVKALRESSSYSPWDVYNENSEIRNALDLIGSGFFSPEDRDLFEPLIHTLLQKGDYFLVLADMKDYDTARMDAFGLYKDSTKWYEKCVINLANMGKFSSDRTIQQYADEIWSLKPVPKF